MQIDQTRRSHLPAVLLFALGLLVACGDENRNHRAASEENLIATADGASSHIRALYFAQDDSTAARQGKHLIAQFPDSAELAAWQVLNLARSGNGQIAVAEARDMLQRFPDSAWSRFALAATMMWNREIGKEEALHASAAAYAANPEHDDFLWLRAESLRLRDGKQEAISLLESHESRLRESPELLNVRAAALFDLALLNPQDDDKRQVALDAYARSRELAPDNVNAWFAPGWFLLMQDRPADAYPLLKSAASLSRAPRVQESFWSSILKRDDLTLAEKHSEFDANVSRLLDSPGVALELVPAAAEMYRELGLHEQQIAIEDRVLTEYPASEAAEHVLMNRMVDSLKAGDEGSPEFVEAIRTFLLRDPIHEPYYRINAQLMLFHAIRDKPRTDPVELLNLIRAMSREEGRASVMAHSEGAIALASRKVSLEEAESLAVEGLAMVPEFVEAQRDLSPKALPLPDPTEALEAAMRDALGWVYYNQGRIDDAERELLTAHKLDPARSPVLLHLGMLYESKQDFRRAETWFIRCAALPMDEHHPCANVLHDYYVRREGSSDGLDAYIASIRDRIYAESDARVAEDRLPQPVAVPSFTLTSLEGTPVTLADLKGKLAIVKFWAVWCAPCRAEMPEFSEFAARFADDSEIGSEVEVLTVSLDPNPERVRDWLSDNDLEFEVLVDDGYSRKAGVSAIPTTWFLDARSQKVFEVRGLIPDLENEYVARLKTMQSGTRR